MSTLDIIDRITDFTGVLGNLLVIGFATAAYQATRKRSLLLIAISCAISVVFSLGFLVLDGEPSWVRWGVYTLAMNLGSVLWVYGAWRLFRDYTEMVERCAQPTGCIEPGDSASVPCRTSSAPDR